MSDMMELQIAAMSMRDKVPKDGPLPDRIRAAMVAVRTAPEGDVFWMSSRAPNDDTKFRTALAAVMLSGSEDDRRVITNSMKPLQALSAAMTGLPIDLERVLESAQADDIPLMKLWHETAKP